ncbi:MAG TPA: hypothetical protein VNM92_06310 [Thermoanaerobaculia bacterium]|nr:hypothetical protein [Thermoanaerobaculia bacterium]
MNKAMRLVALALGLLLLPVGAAQANHYADFYVIPTAAHVMGANNTLFMTDIAVQNLQSTPLTIDLIFIQSGENFAENIFPILPAGSTGSTGFVVPAGGNLLIKDVLNGFTGGRTTNNNSVGAILIGSQDARPFAVTSRTYTLNSGGTVGVTVPPARDFLTNATGNTNTTMAVAYVPGLIVNSQYRTNLGFVAANIGSEPLYVEVTLRNAGGPILNARRTFTIAAGNISQIQFSSRAVSDSTFDIGSADFRIVQGSGSVVPFATVIDNVTGDAAYIAGVFPPNNNLAFSTSFFRQIFGRATDR